MQTFDQSIFQLYEQKLIPKKEALRWTSNVDEFKLKMLGVTTTGEATVDEMACAGAGGIPLISKGGR